MDALTGERLDDASALHRADLARHRVAYRFAAEAFSEATSFQSGLAQPGRSGQVLDLGCGTGHGAVLLAGAVRRVVAFDRVAPPGRARGARVGFVRGDLESLPFADRSFARIASFQVIEHLADPTRYLAEIARVLAPDGQLLLSTPNRLESDGENPFHLREYVAHELEGVLSAHFGRVELRGIHALGPAADFQRERLRRIRRITRLDPLGLRHRLPRPFVDRLFARFALVVRRGAARAGVGLAVADEHFRVAAADPDCLDLLALVSEPKWATVRASGDPTG